MSRRRQVAGSRSTVGASHPWLFAVPDLLGRRGRSPTRPGTNVAPGAKTQGRTGGPGPNTGTDLAPGRRSAAGSPRGIWGRASATSRPIPTLVGVPVGCLHREGDGEPGPKLL